MKKKTKLEEEKVKVERDVRDGSRDYYLPASKAKALYEAGKLDWDLTNHCYIEISPRGYLRSFNGEP